MNSLIENIQLLFICNKEKDAELYQNALNKIKSVERILDHGFSKLKFHLKSLRSYLKEENAELNENAIDEAELNQITCLFEKGFETHEYQKINEILFSSIEQLENKHEKLSETVYQKLISNIEEYFDSDAHRHVSFSCLYFLLFYIFKIVYKSPDRRNEFERKYKLKAYLDYDSSVEDQIPSLTINDSHELKLLQYLKKYLYHSDAKLSLRTHILCRHLNIPLSLDKMLYFITQTLEQNEKDNLVIFIGVTGSGKSTIINYLCGTEYDQTDYGMLVPKRGHFNRVKISDENSIYSETMFCETVKYEDKNDSKVLNFYDTPGFNDINTNTESSIIASLGFPLLVKTAQKIKAIVVVMNYDLFDTNRQGRGEAFEKFSQDIMQIFKNFTLNEDKLKKNESRLNILFAISRPDTRKTRDSLIKILKLNLSKFQTRIENEKRKLDDSIQSLESTSLKIDLFNNYIDQLELIKDGKDGHNENVFKFNEIGNDKGNVLDELEALKLNLEHDLTRVKTNQSNIDDRLQIWKTNRKELENKKQEAKDYINRYQSESKMIDLLNNAIDTERIFMLPCDTDCNDKQLLLEKLKSINDEHIVKESLFSFNTDQETFRKVREWGIEIASETNCKINSLKEAFTKLNEMDSRIESTQSFIYCCKLDLRQLMREKNLASLNRKDFRALNTLKKESSRIEDNISCYKESIKKLNKELSYFDYDLCEYENIHVTDHRFFLYKMLGIRCSWTWTYSYTKNIPIKKIKLYCMNSAQVLYEHTVGTSAQAIKAGDFGTFEISQIGGNHLQFVVSFRSSEGFNDTVGCVLYTCKSQIQAHMELKNELKKKIKSYESEIYKFNYERESLEYKLKQEKRIIELKRKGVQSELQRKYNLIKERLISLSFNKDKLIQYLLLEKLANNQEQLDIKKVETMLNRLITSSNIVTNGPVYNRSISTYNILGIFENSLVERLKYFEESEINILNSLSKSIGLSMELLYELLNEDEWNSGRKSLEEELDSLKQDRNETAQEFLKNKHDLEKFVRTKLKTYDEIEKVVKFSKDYSFIKSRSYLEESKILDKDVSLEPIEPIWVEDEETATSSDTDDSISENEESVEERSNQITEINHDFKLNNLTQNLKIKKISINELKEATNEVLCFYIPQLVHAALKESTDKESSGELHELVNELLKDRAKNSTEFALVLYLHLKQEEENLNPTKSVIDQECLEFYKHFLDILTKENPELTLQIKKFQAFIDYLDEKTKQTPDLSKLLFLMDTKYGIKRFELGPKMQSKTNPQVVKLLLESLLDNKPEKQYSILYKKGDDCRQDFVILQAIKLINDIFQSKKLPDNKKIIFNTYNVAVLSNDKAIIEMVKNVRSIQDIFNENKSIKEYLNECKLNGFHSAFKNYTKSLAGYLLISYLFSIGDRHYDNILIKDDGTIFHIDFGFIMGDEPKAVGGMRIAPEIKWNYNLIEPIVSDLSNPLNDHAYIELMEACFNGLEIIRENKDLLINQIFNLMLNSKIPSITKNSLRGLEERLMVDVNDKAKRKELFNSKISENYNSWLGWIFVDLYHARPDILKFSLLII